MAQQVYLFVFEKVNSGASGFIESAPHPSPSPSPVSYQYHDIPQNSPAPAPLAAL